MDSQASMENREAKMNSPSKGGREIPRKAVGSSNMDALIHRSRCRSVLVTG